MNRRFLLIAIVLVIMGYSLTGVAVGGEPRKHALLIGCTHYRNLSDSQQLKGPGNDVVLMRDLLVNRFGFPAEAVRVLAEDQPGGDASRPTRAIIQREFAKLAEVAGSKDQVVVLMSGHGSQQPDQDPPNAPDREPDGLFFTR